MSSEKTYFARSCSLLVHHSKVPTLHVYGWQLLNKPPGYILKTLAKVF